MSLRSYRFTEEEDKWIDALRGDLSRNAYLKELVEADWESMKGETEYQENVLQKDKKSVTQSSNVLQEKEQVVTQFKIHKPEETLREFGKRDQNGGYGKKFQTSKK